MKEMPSGRLNAKMTIKVKYGMHGDEDCELDFNAVLDIYLQPDGIVSQIFTHWNPNTPMQGGVALA